VPRFLLACIPLDPEEPLHAGQQISLDDSSRYSWYAASSAGSNQYSKIIAIMQTR
jgi:hypothetical protein